jgi:hypothetical protein
LSQENTTKSSAIQVGGTYYLYDVVLDHTQPFLEHSFIQRVSNIGFSYTSENYEDSNYAKTKLTPIQINGVVYLEDFILGLSTGSYGSTNFTLKANSNQYYGIRNSTTNFSAGYYVLPTTTVSLFTSQSKSTYSAEGGATTLNDWNVNTTGLMSHSVSFLGSTRSLIIDLTLDQVSNKQTATQKNNELYALLSYYPESHYYIQSGLKINSGDDATTKGNTFLLGYGVEVTPSFGLFLSTKKFIVSDSSQNTGSTETLLTARFRF